MYILNSIQYFGASRVSTECIPDRTVECQATVTGKTADWKPTRFIRWLERVHMFYPCYEANDATPVLPGIHFVRR